MTENPHFTTIEKEAQNWGMQYDIYALEPTDKQIELAEKYANIYCRNGKCQYDYACCVKCISKTQKGCKYKEIPVICAVFFCSFVLKQIPTQDREILLTFRSLLEELECH